MDSDKKCEFLIIGGGIVGLSIAFQLISRQISKRIIIIDKEKELGLHSSGRNSGVLHAGLYYKPGSLKAKVCVKGSQRLKDWIVDHKIPLNKCGKVIVPNKYHLDKQIDTLAERGRANGAEVQIIDESQLREIVPEAVTASGRAIWSPNTAVVKPIEVINKLKLELEQLGVEIFTSISDWKVDIQNKKIQLNNNYSIYYDQVINSAGLNADKVAHAFNVGKNYRLMPFKGIYWQIKKSSKIKIKTNLYPVPDLDLPFLGVHFTPDTDPSPKVSIGPTASFAFGRENYKNLDDLEFFMSIKNISMVSKLYLMNRGGFRRYFHEQALLYVPNLFFKAAKELIPSLKYEDIEKSNKVGIRSQLLDIEREKLVDDFLCLDGPSSTHLLNSISPAFTASFEFADYVLDLILKKINN